MKMLSQIDPFVNKQDLHLRLNLLADQLIRIGAREMCDRDSNWMYKIALSESASYFYEEVDCALESVGIVPPWFDALI